MSKNYQKLHELLAGHFILQLNTIVTKGGQVTNLPLLGFSVTLCSLNLEVVLKKVKGSKKTLYASMNVLQYYKS